MIIDLKSYRKDKKLAKENELLASAMRTMYDSLDILSREPQNFNNHNTRTVMDCLRANSKAIEVKLKNRGYFGSKGSTCTTGKE